MSIRGGSNGYNRKVRDSKHEWKDQVPTRTPEPTPRNTRIVRVDIPTELLERIEEVAEEKGLSRPTLIIRLLKEGVNSHKSSERL